MPVVLTRVSAIEALQHSDQSNLSRQDHHVKALETWKVNAEKMLKKIKEKKVLGL